MGLTVQTRLLAACVRSVSAILKFGFGILVSTKVSGVEFVSYVQIVYFLPFMVCFLGLEIYNRIQIHSVKNKSLASRLYWGNLANQFLFIVIIISVISLVDSMQVLMLAIAIFVITEVYIIESNRYLVAISEQLKTSNILLLKNLLSFLLVSVLSNITLETLLMIISICNLITAVYVFRCMNLSFAIKRIFLPVRLIKNVISKYWMVLISVMIVRFFWSFDKILLDYVSETEAFSYAYTFIFAAGLLTIYEIVSGMFITPKLLKNFHDKAPPMNSIYSELLVVCSIILATCLTIGFGFSLLHTLLPNTNAFNQELFFIMGVTIVVFCFGYPASTYLTLTGSGKILLVANILLLLPMIILWILLQYMDFNIAPKLIISVMLLGSIISVTTKVLGVKNA